jgi:hypothetical protein
MAKSARRKRKGRITMPGGESVPQQQSTGRPVQDKPLQVATEARQRHTGIKDKADALQAALGTYLGLCIVQLTNGDERAQLINTWDAISASRRNYMLRYIGQSGDAQGAAIGYVADPMQTDKSMTVDVRTADERDAHAKSSWALWDKRIKALPLQMRWAMQGAISGFIGDAHIWRDHKPTETGRLAVAALGVLTKA